MIQVEPISQFEGFGKGNPGEYFYSQGMAKSRFGLVPGWKIANAQTDSDLSVLGLGNFFTQGLLGGSGKVAVVDDDGDIYTSDGGTSPYVRFYKPGDTSNGNGLIFDQKNRLLFFTNQYIGQVDGSDYSTGTVATTNGVNNVIGTGTTFTVGMEGKRIKIGNTFHTIALFNSATDISVTPVPSSTATGLSYTIFTSVTDQWKDLTTANNNSRLRQPDIYEDWVVFPVVDGFAALNVTDDSIANPGITMPTGFTPVLNRAGRNGILLGVNFNNRGFVALWDAQAPRSIAPWIWFNANVKAIVPVPTTGAWIVITTKGIYNTNGYSLEPILEGASDDNANSISILSNIKPQGAEIIGNKLAFWGTGNGNFNRNKDGLYLLDLSTGMFEFVPVYNGCLRAVTGGAIFIDSSNKIHLSYTTDNPNHKFIGSLQNSKPSSAYVITERLGNLSANKKNAEGLKLSIGISSRIAESAPVITFNVTAKIYNFKRPLWGDAQTNAASSTADVLKINGSVFSGAQVGDEVTIVEGVNAGQIRHIASIANPGTNTETWTLDSVLPNNTEDTIYVSVSPFQLIKKQTLTNLSEIRDLYYDIRNKIAGKNYLVKIVFDGMTGVTPELHSGFLIYDDKGLI
jgi:hypothetical protein